MNYFISMLSEKDGTGSSKRWIAVTIGAAIIYISVFMVRNYKEMAFATLLVDAAMVILLLGIATLPQVLALLNRKVPGTVTEQTDLSITKTVQTAPKTESPTP